MMFDLDDVRSRSHARLRRSIPVFDREVSPDTTGVMRRPNS
jgi:hypothetical protein